MMTAAMSATMIPYSTAVAPRSLLIWSRAVSQDAKQEVAGQVRMRSPPEYVMPTASKLSDVEIAQVRDLVVERRSIRHCRTDHHAWHGIQAARRREGREADCAPLLWTMR